eukprot:CAMPEP_0172708710 /NCGR_PEP_ID=MMETSP1074-20121228/51883_1 /TAXON_ID=2916 /ORGANISM="Ceratium fusus, Strain PA161109" /LENGTH=30 /DNA_ID= /DNA_START= /DNA_END= /DNA_ORIENTATION=
MSEKQKRDWPTVLSMTGKDLPTRLDIPEMV